MSIGCDTDVSAEHIWGDNSGELSGSSYLQLFSLVDNKKNIANISTAIYAVWYGDIKVIFQAQIAGNDRYYRNWYIYPVISFMAHLHILGDNSSRVSGVYGGDSICQVHKANK